MKDDDTCWYFLGSENTGLCWKCSYYESLLACVYMSIVHCCLSTHLYGFVLSFSFTIHYYLLFFSTGYGECLLDEPVGRTYELPTLLPGQIYNANRQCELMFGPGSQICPYMVSWLAIKASKTTLKKWGIKTSGGNRSEMIVVYSDIQENLVFMNKAVIHTGQQIWNCGQLIAFFVTLYCNIQWNTFNL